MKNVAMQMEANKAPNETISKQGADGKPAYNQAFEVHNSNDNHTNDIQNITKRVKQASERDEDKKHRKNRQVGPESHCCILLLVQVVDVLSLHHIVKTDKLCSEILVSYN
uniref:Uncharacterized protein n=1 Tax=Guillardia theta TaxID=55529 RepID=A0A7S4JR31_GUITH